MICQYNQNHSSQTEIRKLQGIHGNSTYTIVLPKEFVASVDVRDHSTARLKTINDFVPTKRTVRQYVSN